MNRVIFISLFLLIRTVMAFAQPVGYKSTITPLPGEKWWGGMVALGSKMPFPSDMRLFNLSSENLNN